MPSPVKKPRLLDLFCGAGGAAMGYHRAGFEVVGVDIAPQPRYPFEFCQMSALEVLPRLIRHGSFRPAVPTDIKQGDFVAIHASPPCQHASALRSLHPDREYPALIEPVRELLKATGLPYVIENVVGAALHEPFMLCGSMFGANYRRHRLFETNFPVLVPTCAHGQQSELVGVYGASDGARKPDGSKHPGWKRGPRQATTVEAREVMGMPWAIERRGLTEAIPPAYTELIGHQLLALITATAPKRSLPDPAPAGLVGDTE